MTCKHALLLSFSLLLPIGLSASDLAKEKRWEAQIIDALLDGEAIHLHDGRGEFLAIETPAADARTEQVAIIMHGTGVHPDWPTVVQPLRVELTQSGWHTLSIQMPVLHNEAEHKDYLKIYDWVPGRINAAIRHARQTGAKRVVLIGHSQGSTMTAYALANGSAAADGFIAIGMGPGFADSPMDNLKHLGMIQIPVLDLYGSEDLQAVLASAVKRQSAARKSNPRYRQQQIPGADHFFDGEEELLLETVNTWLARHVNP
ncbi:MAG: alpha/beta fold hydrolase [Gammaproteobacteria bacterium]|nr:alpha/beta fold hydrolase [Gammaproteobacteria bacterium]